MKGKIVQYLFCIALLFVTSSVALGRSVDDGNNTATTAEAVSLQTTVSDVVGPDDQFDYYLLKVADGDSITGSIKFESKVVGTVLRITGPDGTIFEKSTTDESLSFEYTIPNKLNKPGAYYARVSFWSTYNYNHEYTLTFDLAKKLHILKEAMVALQDRAPWPNQRADARNTGRSGFPGPQDELLLTESLDLFTIEFTDKLFTKTGKNTLFRSLRAGPDNWVCFILWDKPAKKAANWVLAYDLTYGTRWGDNAVCKDVAIGKAQAATSLEWYACFPAPRDPNKLSRIPFSGCGGLGGIYLTEGYNYTGPRRLHLIGKRVYVSTGTDNGPVRFQCYGQDACEYCWGLGGQPNVAWVCEDDESNAFVRWGSGVVSRFASDGDGTPSWDFTDSAIGESAGDAGVPQFYYPILGDDGLLWVSSLYYDDSAPTQTLKYGSRYYIIQDFGTSPAVIKQGQFDNGFRILKACYGADHRLYLAMNGSYISCYKNGDEKVWQVQLGGLKNFKPIPVATGKTTHSLPNPGKGNPGSSSQGGLINSGNLNVAAVKTYSWKQAPDGGRIVEMIMDRDNTIYVLRAFGGEDQKPITHKLYILDPDDGSVITEQVVDFPGDDGPYTSLAIGSYSQLLILNSAGWLNVYKEKYIPAPAEMAVKQDAVKVMK